MFLMGKLKSQTILLIYHVSSSTLCGPSQTTADNYQIPYYIKITTHVIYAICSPRVN